MKKVYLIGALLSFGLLAEAQSFMRFEDKAFNFGAKVGFNATFPVINSLSINGKEAENIDIEYKVGYLGTFIKYYKISQLIHTQSIAN